MMVEVFLIWCNCLTRKPGDPESVKVIKLEVSIGPSQTNQEKKFPEMLRLMRLNMRNLYQIMKIYFKEIFDILSSKLNRVEFLLKEPRSTLSWHRDQNQDYTFL